MERKYLSEYGWLDAATRGIRFKPDRMAVRAELFAHLEDKQADLRRIFPDMTRGEAERRALESMGDPAELGRELAKIHKPWLGYLWVASRWAAILAAVAIAASVLLGGTWLEDVRWRVEDWLDNSEGEVISRALYEDGEPRWEGERLAVYAPEAETRLGRCTISVPRAALWEEQGENTLYLELRLSYDLPWERSEGPLPYLWAEDDQGNRYWEQQGYTARGHQQTGLRWITVNMIAEDVPRDLEYITLHYLPGTDLNLRVDLKEVGA